LIHYPPKGSSFLYGHCEALWNEAISSKRSSFITPGYKKAKNNDFYCCEQDFEDFARELRKSVSASRRAAKQ